MSTATTAATTTNRAAMAEPVVDVLARAREVNLRIGALLVELLNDDTEQPARLRELGQHLGSLSAECLARAAELDGRCLDPPQRVVIDAREEP